ncbi:MAG: sulfurtransferase TusA family protein [Colwellia sp.]
MQLTHYDASEERCPLPLVNMRLMLKNMQKGCCLMLKVSDSSSKKDIPKYLDKHGYHYVTKKINLHLVEISIYV